MEELKNKAFDARVSYKNGFITRTEAKEYIQPYIDMFNKKSKEIAKKYGMKPKTITMAGFLR
jgi:putative uncharacterized protein gp37